MLNIKEAVYRILDIAPFLYKQPIEVWKALQGRYKYSEILHVCNQVQDKIWELMDDMEFLEQFDTIGEALNYAEKKRFEERKKARE